MQVRKHTLLDTFFQYCGRNSQSITLNSCGDGRLRYRRSSFYRRNQRKGKQMPNSVGIEVALPQKKERSMKEKIFNTNQMLSISPAVVYTSYEDKHPYLKNQSLITVSRRYCRAKTEGGDTNRSISSSLSYYKPQKLGETHASETSPKMRAKQRPMTAVPNVPASPLSINRLRSIHVQLPQRKGPQMNDYTLNGWETMVD